MVAPAARIGITRLPWLAIGVIVGAAVLLLNAYLPQRALDWVEDAVRERDRGQLTIAIAKDLLSALKDMATGESGYLISGDERFLEPYDRGGAEVPLFLAQIESQVEGTKGLEVVAQLRPAVATVVLVQGRVVDARRGGNVKMATQIVQRGESKVALDRVRFLTGQLIAVEEAAGAALLEETRRRESALSAWLAALTVIDLLVFGAVFFFAFKQLHHRAAVQRELATAGAAAGRKRRAPGTGECARQTARAHGRRAAELRQRRRGSGHHSKILRPTARALPRHRVLHAALP